jgi:ABC-type lipoprotein export system ATPase subunit
MGVGVAQRERGQQLLEVVGLSERMDHKPNQLSSGEQQRVAIARSLILEPKLVLADEPTGNLDSKTGGEVIQLMQDLNQRQATTFIVVTHDPRVAESSQQILHLVDGRLST